MREKRRPKSRREGKTDMREKRIPKSRREGNSLFSLISLIRYSVFSSLNLSHIGLRKSELPI